MCFHKYVLSLFLANDLANNSFYQNLSNLLFYFASICTGTSFWPCDTDHVVY